ncbi:unnamed protein product [Adineta ricciae]|uniref:Thioredoxin domain-containing protein n=1 Tax=Adineta ricciae TaxID=249248 RepID=A0A815DSV9_ADIRI|nr:unnamed protein product [Adineta ricciae]
MGGVAKLFDGHILNKSNEEVNLDSKDFKRKIIGLYFSAHWCPPCQNFTPKLAAFYQAYAREKNFEIIFLSSDYDEASSYYYYQHMPWLRLDYRDRQKKQELESKYGVNGIPALILLDGTTGDVVCADARQYIEWQDPHGTNFPWGPVNERNCCSRCCHTYVISQSSCNYAMKSCIERVLMHQTESQMCTPSIRRNFVGEHARTCFEDLSHDVIYHIFDCLEFFDIYGIFYHLNIRFRRLITHSNLPLKVRISSISRTDFEYYHANLIVPYSHRISSLDLRNRLCFDLLISPHNRLTEFPRLQTLILKNIKPKHLHQVFQDISTLPRLSKFVLHCPGYTHDIGHYFLIIFRLHALRHCEIFFPDVRNSIRLPFAAIDKRSSIEHLTVASDIHLENLDRLLSYVPKLRYFSVGYLGQRGDKASLQLIPMPNLTHLSLGIGGLDFDYFEALIKTFPNIQRLHLYGSGPGDYLNPDRWEELITSSMPFLRIFNIYIDSSLPISSMSQLRRFKSSFWQDRQWFFSYHGSYYRNFYSCRFHSVNPSRLRDYSLRYGTNFGTDPDFKKANLRSVRRVQFSRQKAIYHCDHRFLQATELTLENITSEQAKKDITALEQIISFDNLTKLEINSSGYAFKQLTELLALTPNLHTLKIQRIHQFDETDFTTFPTSNVFQFVSNVNMIQCLSITHLTEVREVRLLFMLCPRLQYFTIHQQQRHAVAIVRYLSSQLHDVAQHLILLTMEIRKGRHLASLKELVRTRECLQNWSLIVENHQVYLWQ